MLFSVGAWGWGRTVPVRRPVALAVALALASGAGPYAVARAAYAEIRDPAAAGLEAAPSDAVPPPAAAPAPPPTPAPGPGLPSAIASILVGSDAPEVGGERLDGPSLRDLYGPRAFTPQWVDGGSPDRIEAALDVLRHARDDGLNPATYHTSAIEGRLTAADERTRAELELLLSDAVMRYAVHVRTGAYRPTRPTKEIGLAPADVDPTVFVLEATAVPDVRAYLASLAPRSAQYAALKSALAHYRAIAAKGGWPTPGVLGKLTPGAVDPTVRALRSRLVASGDVAAGAKKPNVYDPELVKAVKRFQARHGLGADGVVGERTWAALDVPVDERIRQLEIALERTRWLPEDLGERYVEINIPDQQLELRDRTGVEVQMPVIVGKQTWQTPEFSADLTELVFNPPWNVPPKIAKEELLPKARADRSFFAREGIAVRGGVKLASAGGTADDAGGAGVSIVGPIRLRQAPGPKNPLGRVKFNMPNPFGVYLHDTPNKNKFRGPDRRLSHGCVRVGNAPALADAVLREAPEWNDDRRESMLATWQTKTVDVGTPIPVHIVYRTAWVDDAGELQFRDDVYGRDAELLARWDKPRSVRRPPPPPRTSPDLAVGDGEAPAAPRSSGEPSAAPAPVGDAAP
ncbi:MAG TPA: L,D-transpeptidase family protein [Candidatus Binatia bacterium]|nr:L,D-transpeptidase family protein [Candidatus Binatia bacterium]